MRASAWVNATDWDGNRRIVQKGDVGTDDQYRLTAEGGALKFDVAGVGSLTGPLPAVKSWHHVAGTYDGTALCLYEDGVLVASIVASGPIAATSGPLVIGDKPGSTVASDHFLGAIDGVEVDNVALQPNDFADRTGHAPTAVTAVSAAATSGTGVLLSWGIDGTADGYLVEESTDGTTFTTVTTLATPDVSGLLVTGLSPATGYTFRVTATNAAGPAAARIAPPARTGPADTSGLFQVRGPDAGPDGILPIHHDEAADTSASAVSVLHSYVEAGSETEAVFQALGGSVTNTRTGRSYTLGDGNTPAPGRRDRPWLRPIAYSYRVRTPGAPAPAGDVGAFHFTADYITTNAGDAGPAGTHVGPALAFEDLWQVDSSRYDWNDDYIKVQAKQVSVGLEAHRTGDKFGQVVPAAVQQSGDPTKFLTLVNDDYDSNLPSGLPDDTSVTAVIGSGASGRGDVDLARMTLKKLSPGATGGQVQIVLSDPGAVRLFRSDGTLLYAVGQTSSEGLTLDLSHPGGYLAGLLTGDVDVWMEDIHKNNDFTFSVDYTRGDQVVDHAAVHTLIADWTFLGADGNQVVEVTPVWKEALLAATRRPAYGAADNGEGAYYKSRIDGLASSLATQLKVTSDSSGSDSYYDDFADSTDATVSKSFAVLYSADRIYGANPDSPVSSSERDAIKQGLGLNVVHNPGQKSTLKTGPANNPTDIQSRPLAVRNFVRIALVADVVNVGGRIRGAVYAPDANGTWTFRVTTSDGQTVTGRDPSPGNGLSFDFAANARGDLTLAVTGGPRILPGGIPAGLTPGNTALPFSNSALIRVLPQGQVLPQWSQKAWDALHVAGIVPGHPLNRNRRVSELYAQMYNSNPAVFKWAGMAAFASQLVGDAMAEAERFMLTPARNVAPDPKIGFQLLSRGNQDVYDDMYRQLLAYQTGGIAAIRQMQQNQEINQVQLLAWEKIAQGQQARDQQLVWDGNEALLKFEQEVTLQNGAYAANLPYWADLTNAYAPLYGYLAPISSPIPGDDSVFQTSRGRFPNLPPGASIGDFGARWSWIEFQQLPAYMAWSGANPAIDVNKLLNNGYKKR